MLITKGTSIKSLIVLRIASLLVLVFVLAGCSSSKSSSSTGSKLSKKSAKEEKQAASSSKQPLSRKVSSSHDAEVKEVLRLAEGDRWEEAETKANELADKYPQDFSVARTATWVRQQRQLRRDHALEERIREINSKNSVFSPTIPKLLTEHKDRGLPLRQDVQNVVQQIHDAPYVPPNYGKTNYQQGRLFDIEAPEGKMAKILQKDISVHLDNVTLEAIIFNIGQAEGVNFVADKALPAFKQTLSANMEKVKLAEFLRYVSRNLDVQFQVGDDLIWIVDSKDPKRVLEETRFYRLSKGFIMPAQFGPTEVQRVITAVPNVTTTTETQKLERFVNDGAAAVPSLATAMTNFFKGSKFMIDYERNLVVATGTPDQLEVVAKIIEEFDKPVQQVLIEARFITVSEAAFLQLGVSWETGRGQLSAGRVATDFTGLGLIDAGLGFQESFAWTNILSKQSLTATLSALEQGGQSQTLSAPRLTLVNNLPARINDGKIQYYYEEYQVKQTILERRSTSSLVPSGKPAKITSGVSLDVVASIGGDGQSILLGLHPEVNQDVKLVTFATVTDHDETGKVVSSFDIKLPESRSQSLATRVVVKSGQTVVMGGVLERQQLTMVESVPVLGRLPLIGAAFRKRTDVDKPRYLLIFVTATLLSESGEFLVYEEPKTPTSATPK